MKVGAGAIRGSDPGSSAGVGAGVNVREWWGVTLGRAKLWDSRTLTGRHPMSDTPEDSDKS